MSNFSLFHGPNEGYALELYEKFKHDPESVDPATRAFFETWAPPTTEVGAQTSATTSNGQNISLDISYIVGAARLIRYIRELGHLEAQIDPLGAPRPQEPGLQMHIHGVNEEILRQLPADIVRGPLVEGSANALEAINKLRAVYSGKIAYETDHIHHYEERTWIREAIESQRFFYGLEGERRLDLLQRLTEVEIFERFLHQTFVGQKRFSLEGCDMLVPMLDSIIRNAASAGTKEIVLGMAHRGRLNVLAHVLGKPYSHILSEFMAANRVTDTTASNSTTGWLGDVKYHLGARKAYQDNNIESMPITLAPNPSHLEFVGAVVEGRARAAQEVLAEPGAPIHDRRASLAILIHGDAAFPGQGVVPETLNLSQLFGYSTGGTIHIITNNQVGFTTNPNDSRSTLYASDLAKGFEIPIVHVNADDVLACIAVARMAHAYREQFGKDFLIDLVGYRRWGHNEGDEPSFTQPGMYNIITNHPTTRAIWAEQLVRDKYIEPDVPEALIKSVTERLQAARQEAETNTVIAEPPATPPPGIARRTKTAVPAEQLLAYNEALFAWPESFEPHPRLERTLDRRRKAIDQENAIDWGHAELLAFASLIADGVPIRLSGQDSERGTFSHRHAVIHDHKTGEKWTGLHHLPQAQASFAVYNSPLSEVATLGFEYGFSAHAPNALVLWEGQFGDFANGAQVIIDQFIVSGRKKWGQVPALVLLLPHGYEGQGPEHSSARLERFLQLAAEDNIRVANLTSAAQYFHLLRRQARLLDSDPRPLVIMTPKSLLRHPRAGSSLSDLTDGGFQRVIDDADAQTRANEVKRLVLCSGKVYIDLISAPNYKPVPSIAVARVEELYSFPSDELLTVLAGYPNVEEVVWLQEEPKNMGAWSYVFPLLRDLVPAYIPIRYVGRDASASPAEGSLAQHSIVQARILAEAMRVDG
jgi:2-oxoglutarate dehydrogenase E1 component